MAPGWGGPLAHARNMDRSAFSVHSAATSGSAFSSPQASPRMSSPVEFGAHPLLAPVPPLPAYHPVLDIRVAQLLRVLSPTVATDEQRRIVFNYVSKLIKRHLNAEVCGRFS